MEKDTFDPTHVPFLLATNFMSAVGRGPYLLHDLSTGCSAASCSRAGISKREVFGYREHKVVLYANEEGVIEPDDLIWHTNTLEDFSYEDWKPVAIIVCHNDEKTYRLPLDEVLDEPEAWSTDILWLDKEWYKQHKGG